MFGLKFYLNLNKEEIKYDYLLTKLKGANKRSTITNWIKRENIPNSENVIILAKELGAKPENINRVLSEEEMERLEFEFIYKKYEWQEVTYRDDDGTLRTEILWGETDDSRYAEEGFYNTNEDEKLINAVEEFLDAQYALNQGAYARNLVSKLLNLVTNDRKRMELMHNILDSIDKSLKTTPNLVDGINLEVQIPQGVIDGFNMDAKAKNAFFSQEDGSIVTITNGTKEITENENPRKEI